MNQEMFGNTQETVVVGEGTRASQERSTVNDTLQHEDSSNQAELFWEEFYRKQEQVWSGRANPVLIDVVRSLPPGTALDLGCGEGGDAIWLAQHGWQVTAVDVSLTALERASAYSATVGVEAHIDFQQHDLVHTFPTGVFDLVSAQYLHSPIEFPRDHILQAAMQAVAPGGLLLIVDHSHRNPHTRFPVPEEVLTELNLSPRSWHTERLETLQRQALRPNGESITVADNIIAVRRFLNSGDRHE